MKKAIAVLASDEFYPNFKVLYNSIRKYHSTSDVSIFLLYFGNKEKTEPFYPHPWDVYVIKPEQIKPNTLELKARYPMGDYIASHRPAFINWIFKQKYDSVLLLGADCKVYDNLNSMFEDNKNYSVMVTPHILSPYPEDDKFPKLEHIPLGGFINSDVILFNNDTHTQAFLMWMDKKLETQCVRKPSEGLFSDQSWFNFMLTFVPNIKISHDLTINAAYYNMHERTINEYNNKYYVNYSNRLKIYQFSGLDKNNPKNMSLHQNRWEADGTLLKLYKEYIKELEENK